MRCKVAQIVRGTSRAAGIMDLGNVPLFKAMMSRMSWLTERQQVLAQNVANANMPNFKPRDLKPQSFRDMLTGTSGQLALAATQVNHLAGDGAATAFRSVTDRNAALSPSGNGISLEEQMLRVSGTANEFQMTTNLYRHQVGMLKTVIARTA
jgi:flagellar basal-body rod protein FlgB